MLTLFVGLITIVICAFCVWRALQEREVLSIVTVPVEVPVEPKTRP